MYLRKVKSYLVNNNVYVVPYIPREILLLDNSTPPVSLHTTELCKLSKSNSSYCIYMWLLWPCTFLKSLTMEWAKTQYSFGTEAIIQVLEKNGCRAVDTSLSHIFFWPVSFLLAPHTSLCGVLAGPLQKECWRRDRGTADLCCGG